MQVLCDVVYPGLPELQDQLLLGVVLDLEQQTFGDFRVLTLRQRCSGDIYILFLHIRLHPKTFRPPVLVKFTQTQIFRNFIVKEINITTIQEVIVNIRVVDVNSSVPNFRRVL